MDQTNPELAPLQVLQCNNQQCDKKFFKNQTEGWRKHVKDCKRTNSWVCCSLTECSFLLARRRTEDSSSKSIEEHENQMHRIWPCKEGSSESVPAPAPAEGQVSPTRTKTWAQIAQPDGSSAPVQQFKNSRCGLAFLDKEDLVLHTDSVHQVPRKKVKLEPLWTSQEFQYSAKGFKYEEKYSVKLHDYSPVQVESPLQIENPAPTPSSSRDVPTNHATPSTTHHRNARTAMFHTPSRPIVPAGRGIAGSSPPFRAFHTSSQPNPPYLSEAAGKARENTPPPTPDRAESLCTAMAKIFLDMRRELQAHTKDLTDQEWASLRSLDTNIQNLIHPSSLGPPSSIGMPSPLLQPESSPASWQRGHSSSNSSSTSTSVSIHPLDISGTVDPRLVGPPEARLQSLSTDELRPLFNLLLNTCVNSAYAFFNKHKCSQMRDKKHFPIFVAKNNAQHSPHHSPLGSNTTSITGPHSLSLLEWIHCLRKASEHHLLPKEAVADPSAFSGEIQPATEILHCVTKGKDKMDAEILAMVMTARRFVEQLKDQQSVASCEHLYVQVKTAIKEKKRLKKMQNKKGVTGSMTWPRVVS